MRIRCLFLAFVLAVTGCSGGGVDSPFELEILPQFVNGAFPGAELMLLVAVTSEDDSPVTLTANAGDAPATIEPSEIRPGEVAEVSIVPAPGMESLAVSVTGVRGKVERTVVEETPVVPDTDQLGPEARQLMAVFSAWLADERPEFGITPTTELEGNAVAPMLLVVTHYMFKTDAWEIGLAWHIMIPPDDWAEIYLRPRDEAVPTVAFRLASRQAAFADGVVEISEVEPPAEVVR